MIQKIIAAIFFIFVLIVAPRVIDIEVYAPKNPEAPQRQTKDERSRRETPAEANIKPAEQKNVAPEPETTPRVEVAPPIADSGVPSPQNNLPEKLPHPPLINFAVPEKKYTDAIVNIICTAKVPSPHAVLGSGVIIDSRGIVLTNAHIAQFLLFEDSVCEVRSGSPAAFLYRPRIMFISVEWLTKHKRVFLDEHPTGTGENDIALLMPTEESDSTKTYHFLALGPYPEAEGDAVLTIGYPVGILGSDIALNRLPRLASVTRVKNFFTFTTSTIDIISLEGSLLSEQGTSGGAVIDTLGRAVGILVTTSVAEKILERESRAITPFHVNANVKSETGLFLDELLKNDFALMAKNFSEMVAPVLRTLLLNEIQKVSP